MVVNGEWKDEKGTDLCGLLLGLRFISRNGAVLLSCGHIDFPYNTRETKFVRVKELILEEGQRLIGFRSGGRGRNDASHCDF